MSKTHPKQNIPNSPISFFWFVTKQYRWWALAATLMVALAATTSVYLRLLIERLVDDIQLQNFEQATFILILYPVLFFTIATFWRLSGVFGSGWLLGVPKATSDALMEYASKHSHSYFSNRFAGSISNKVSNVSRAMENFVATFLWNLLENIIPLVLVGIIFWNTDPIIGISFVVMILLTLVVNIMLMPRKRKFSLSLAAAQSKTTGFIVDMVSNVAAVRQFARSPEELGRLYKHTTDVRSKGRRSFLYSEYMMLVNSLLFTAFSLFSFVTLADLWLAGEVSSGRLVSFILLVTYVSGTIIFLGRIVSQIAKMYGQAEEGLNEIVVAHEITDATKATELEVEAGEIVFDDVSFKFSEGKVFDDFFLSIPPGQRVGLVGHSGAGKTTFVSLLLRQHDVDSGQLRIDGQDIATVTQDSLRKNIAVVPQEPLLFHRSIRENIMYGKPDATEAELVAAAEKAQAHEFITSLPDGYDTMVGERGIKLSGGQKQRVAIARAILKDAPILVLDEATSALDSESEVAIQKALEKLMEGKTVIAVAHRLSTLRKMDRIIVLEDGKIVEDGTHYELAKGEGSYQRLWEHQAGGFLQDD